MTFEELQKLAKAFGSDDVDAIDGPDALSKLMAEHLKDHAQEIFRFLLILNDELEEYVKKLEEQNDRLEKRIVKLEKQNWSITV